MVSAKCPACSGETYLIVNPKMGQAVRCSSCGAQLEVVWLDPVELDWPFDDDEGDELDDDYWDE